MAARRIGVLLTATAALWFGAFTVRAPAQGFFQNLTVRQNANTKTDIAQPATFQITIPDSGPTTATVAAALLWDAAASDLATVSPFIEYTRHPELASPQNILQVGLEAEWQLQPIGRGLHTNAPLLLCEVNYQHDWQAHSHGGDGSILYTQVFRDRGLPNTVFDIGKAVRGTYAPFVGAEYESASADSGPSESVLRFVWRVEAALYPIAATLDERAELVVDYSFRYDVSGRTRLSAADSGRSRSFFTAGANYYFLKGSKGRAGIGVAFVTGEDPSQGFANQRYWQFGAKLKL